MRSLQRFVDWSHDRLSWMRPAVFHRLKSSFSNCLAACVGRNLYDLRVGYAKVILNVVFVVGSFVTLAGADVLGESLLIDVYVLGLIGFLLWLRILLSERNNRRICQACKLCFQ